MTFERKYDRIKIWKKFHKKKIDFLPRVYYTFGVARRRCDTAKRFKHRVTNEVLSAIRKTGKYKMTATQAAAETLPARETTNDDYLRAASIVASCKNERLPYVLSYPKMAGISAAYASPKRDGRNTSRRSLLR